ncbi:hypothetical protein BDW75DRAFT_198296 [Aspergillus navahoensis]
MWTPFLDRLCFADLFLVAIHPSHIFCSFCSRKRSVISIIVRPWHRKTLRTLLPLIYLFVMDQLVWIAGASG